MKAPATSGPTDSMNMMLAMTIIQTIIGMSRAFMPGAREFIVVVMKLMPPSRKATNSNATASTQSMEPRGVRLYSAAEDSGGYAVQAPPNAPPGTNQDAISTTALAKKIWKLSRLIRGKTMSSQPIISGIRKLPNAAMSTGMATQKIMIVPCWVTSALYSPADTTPKPGTGSPG